MLWWIIKLKISGLNLQEHESKTSISSSVSDEAPSTSSANISRRNVGYSTFMEGDKEIYEVSLNSTSLSLLSDTHHKPSSLSFEHVKVCFCFSTQWT